MPPDRYDAAYMWDMLVHARHATDFTRNKTFEQYLADPMLRAAVERVVMIIGEAASKVSAEYRASTPEIPWIPIIKQRHRLVHEYGGIDHDKIWRVATHYVPELIVLLEQRIPPPPPDPEPEQDHAGPPAAPPAS